MKTLKQKTIILSLILLCTVLFSITAKAATGLHETTTPVTTNAPSSVDVHHSRNFWVYTKRDATGYSQLYYQYLPFSTLTPSVTLPETRLTTSSFNKTNPKWGGDDVDMYVYADGTDYASGTVKSTCSNGTLIYYLGNGNASSGDSNTEIHLICVEGLSTLTPNVVFDIKLTEWSTDTTYDVQDYDVVSESSTYIIKSTSTYVSAYPVALTDTNGELHFVQHEWNSIIENADNLTALTIVHDYTDVYNAYDWQAWVPAFDSYASPKLDSLGHNIVFLGQPSGQTNYEVGTISIYGKSEYQLTAFDKDISNPQFANMSSDYFGYGLVPDIFFEITESNTTRLASLYSATTSVGTLTWCNVAMYLTDDSHSNQKLDTSMFAAKTVAGRYFQLAYEKTQLDGYRDIYTANYDAFICSGTSDAGTTLTGTTSPVTELTENIDDGSTVNSTLIQDEIQITCQNDNSSPKILPSIYFDITNAYSTSSPTLDFTDIVSNRDYVDGSGESLMHLYNVEEATGECANTCWEYANGDPIDDNNNYEDGDGYMDFCETFTCDANELLANPLADFDADGIRNVDDICACSYNPTQDDDDGDDRGDGNIVTNENGCDNCLGHYNPGTKDWNGDGVSDNLDGDVTQEDDSDGDGIGDACDEVVDECGETDQDYDGVYDLCDNCINTYNPDQANSDDDSFGNACDNCAEDDNEDQADEDSDNVGDVCDNCIDVANEDQADADGNGIGDMCEEEEEEEIVITEEPEDDIAPAEEDISEPSLPEFAAFGGADCGCNMSQVAMNPGQLRLLYLLLMMFMPVIITRIRKR